ncbi:hypothetical protein O7627_02985 [Solwaraspora sp. WMMD1047]|uniref:hypothetical protein n=1 Tax=Solwaraspora sp. WMMD1047 TaxID=3016102 RepID=UPI0024173330|nr:hypothetical protein [Solwaraspora sp. WMMD1047]MDG4828269.1 hypothetical protein [Solwaraspora sp. WMMD1047]
MVPKPGDVLLIDGRASVQFAGDRALRMRVTSVCGRPTYRGWCWLTGYSLDPFGNAEERREVFVQVAGLQVLPMVNRARLPVQPWAVQAARRNGV